MNDVPNTNAMGATKAIGRVSSFEMTKTPHPTDNTMMMLFHQKLKCFHMMNPFFVVDSTWSHDRPNVACRMHRQTTRRCWKSNKLAGDDDWIASDLDSRWRKGDHITNLQIDGAAPIL